MITVMVVGGPEDGQTIDLPALECEEDVRKEINGSIYVLHLQEERWIASPA